MRLLVTVVDPRREGPRCRDVLIEAPAGTTLADVSDDLRREVGCREEHLAFRAEGRSLEASHPLGEPPLLHGAILTLERPASSGMPLTPEAVVSLDVVGGPGAGQVVPLGRGVHVVGRSGGCAVRLADGTVSRHHLELCVTSTGVTARDLSPTNRSTLGGAPLGSEAAPFEPGERLRLGSTTLVHRLVPVTPAASIVVDGFRTVHRPPRFTKASTVAEIEFPRRPTRPDRARLPLVAALVPTLLSMLLAVVLHSPVMLLFALLTPAMLVGQWWSDRRNGRVSHRRRLAQHAQEHQQAGSALHVALEREDTARHEEAPDLATLARLVSGVDARLWERRPMDQDYLALRLGVGPQVPRTRVTGDPDEPPAIPQLEVPVVVPLAELGVLGLTGPRARSLATARSLIAQLCTWHSPLDLRLMVLTADSAGMEVWGWTRLLPHVAPVAPGSLAAIGDLSHEGTLARRVAELTTLLTSRKAAQAPPGARRPARPDVVVVVDGSERMRREPGVAELLRDGPSAGIHFICLDHHATRLPPEATARVVLSSGPSAEARVDRADGTTTTYVPDLPSKGWAEGLARAMAPLEDATPVENGPTLPDHVDFLEIHRRSGTCGDPLDVSDITRHWAAPGRRRPLAVLGQGDQEPVAVDLVQDGPHVLVGGTTGAGKSELLQTLVASLALHARPDELTFVLVDYKGGSAFRDCAELPHVLGTVTDLDEHLTARALTSLGAELKRRERLFAELGAKDLDDYRRVAGPEHEPLARLVLVVDEFRVLAEELPDFVSGLVRLAAVGRSLGVHLVLATQRPAGIISADIRANVSLRVALRVGDRTDSDDVIDAPDAAWIPDRIAGRAYLRTGSNRLVPIQVAHAGSAPPGGSGGQSPVRPVSRTITWEDWLQPLPQAMRREPEAMGGTTLQRLAATLNEASRLLGLRRPASPWLPPLPDLLPASDPRLRTASPDHAVPLGLIDRPMEQRQPVFTWDPSRNGHLGIGGGARTGRTTAIVAVALRLAERFSPAALHLHMLQGHPGSLDCLSVLPHSGSITAVDDAQRLRRAVLRLAQGQNAAGHRSVVLIDGWEAVTDALDDLDQGESTERLIALVRDGLSRGVHVVVTGGRAVASGRLGSLLQRRLLLDMPDPVDLTLAGISPVTAARRRPPGRALDVRSEAEVQLSLPGDDPSADHGTLALQVAAAVATGYGHLGPAERPWRLPPLPEHVSLEELPDVPDHLLVGIGGDDVEPVGFDLGRDQRRVLVLGPAHSGKSTLLHSMAVQLLAAGHEVAVIAPRRSPLRRLPPRPRLHVLDPDECDRFIALRRLQIGLAVLVDDSECLDGTSIENALVEVSRLVEQREGLVAAALDTRRTVTAFRGLVPELSRSGTGFVLCPSSATDGDLLRTRVEPQSVRTPGRGLLVTDGLTTLTQVAAPPPVASGSADTTTGATPLALVTGTREEVMGDSEGR